MGNNKTFKMKTHSPCGMFQLKSAVQMYNNLSEFKDFKFLVDHQEFKELQQHEAQNIKQYLSFDLLVGRAESNDFEAQSISDPAQLSRTMVKLTINVCVRFGKNQSKNFDLVQDKIIIKIDTQTFPIEQKPFLLILDENCKLVFEYMDGKQQVNKNSAFLKKMEFELIDDIGFPKLDD